MFVAFVQRLYAGVRFIRRSCANVVWHYFLLLGIVWLAYSLTTNASTPPLSSSAEILLPRHFDSLKLQKFAQESAFQYEFTPPPDSWWQRIKYQIEQWLLSLLTQGYGQGTLKLILYTIISICCLLALAALLRIKISGLFFRSSRPQSAFSFADEDKIDGIDFSAEIEKAIAQQQYRRAIRLHYLFILKLLTERKWVAFQPHKTNSDYLQEFPHNAFHKQFAHITYLFDTIWYGDSPFVPADFEQLQQPFIAFREYLNQQ